MSSLAFLQVSVRLRNEGVGCLAKGPGRVSPFFHVPTVPRCMKVTKCANGPKKRTIPCTTDQENAREGNRSVLVDRSIQPFPEQSLLLDLARQAMITDTPNGTSSAVKSSRDL